MTMYGMGLACIFVVIEMLLHTAKVTVQEKRSFKKAVREEIKFYLKFGENVKPVLSEEEQGSEEESEQHKGSPPPIGFILDEPNDVNESDKMNGFGYERKSEESGKSKSKKSTPRSNGGSYTQSS